jgi:uncharacterized protein (UPF0248 family)
MHPLKNVFNKMIWDARERTEDYVIHYVHRGVPGDSRHINASSITKVGASWFTYATPESDETLIPFHRVTRIVNVRTGKTVWVSKSRARG